MDLVSGVADCKDSTLWKMLKLQYVAPSGGGLTGRDCRADHRPAERHPELRRMHLVGRPGMSRSTTGNFAPRSDETSKQLVNAILLTLMVSLRNPAKALVLAALLERIPYAALPNHAHMQWIP
jgi:hypothetical protein